MELKNLNLNRESICPSGSRHYEAVEIGKYKEDGELKELSIKVSARKGDTLKVKIPLSLEKRADELQELIEKEGSVPVEFFDLKLTPYAFKPEQGDIKSGVSGRAGNFQIVEDKQDDLIDL